MQIRNPRETHDAALEIGGAKVELNRKSPVRVAVLSICAGAYISLGALLSIIVGYGFPEIAASNPGLQKILSGLTFPVGLLLIVVLGGELFTGNNALLMPGVVSCRFGWRSVLTNWIIIWIFNFVGALIFIAVFLWGGEVLSAPWSDNVAQLATAKVSMSWWTVFFKAIGANWCVCLAVWLALTGKTLVEKILGCWIPVTVFVALGFEHCIANMFFIPAGMLSGAPVTIGQMFTANLIPATLGNVVGGALLVGVLFSWLHGKGRREA